MTELVDAKARARILTEYETTFFVEAAAGTGKTTALVGRIVGLIRSGKGTLARIVSVTFTEKAAGEMKLRLRLELEKARLLADPTERNRLDRALEELELAHIGTIHAFCGDLLGERPVEAGIDPSFTMLDDAAAAAIADQAFERWLQKILANPPEGPRRILRRRSGSEPPHEQLRAAMHALCDHRDFAQAWRRDPFDRQEAIDVLLDELAEVGELASFSSWADDYLARNLAEIASFVGEATRLEAVRGRDYDGLEADLRDLATNRRRFKGWDHKGAPRTTFGHLSRDQVLARRDGVRAKLKAFVALSDADLAPLVHDALQEAIMDYEALKSRTGSLDFLDLLIKMRNLVRDDEKVRKELQDRFSHFFVDEFQDTDPLQAEILLLIASNNRTVTDWRAVEPVPGKLFLVGDPKQSIYRFRRADVALYAEIKKLLLDAGAELLHLSTSFRATPSIQRFINKAFAPAIAADEDADGYVALERARPDVSGQPTIVALPAPRPYGDYGKVTDWCINESLPGAVGAFVDWLINESGWTVEEGGQQTAIRPRHIAILFRRFRNFRADVTRPYVRELEARRIPHVLVGGRSFHDREEVIALRNAITAIEWPDDELEVFATLRGPLFALSDESLLLYRQTIDGEGNLAFRRLDPMRIVDRAILAPAALEVADALDLLRQLHVGRNSRPIAETLTMFLEAVRAQAGIALWQNGEQALANCQRLIDTARRFERTASSFRAFVESIESDAEHGGVDEAPIVEEGTEGVRVMTVFKAKGLEFPIVILGDPTCPASRDRPSRHIDTTRSLWLESVCGASPVELLEASDLELKRDRAEAVRVAYVAATRARDLLVVPACGDAPIEGWFEAVNPVLYPVDAARRTPVPAPGCPAFGEESILDRGPRGKPPLWGSVRPGLHTREPGALSVTWWDPACLQLEIEELAPLRHQRLLELDPGEVAATDSVQRHDAWKAQRRKVLAGASLPALRTRTITSLARDGEAQESRAEPVEVQVVAREGIDRPGGRRFGTLVHAVLALIDLQSSSVDLTAIAAVQGKIVGATKEEIDAAVATVSRAKTHPLLQRAADAAKVGRLRREIPVMLMQDEILVEGVVDLAFREDLPDFAGWTVVDFKTDRELAEARDRYVRQVQLYSRAVSASTGLPARGVLLAI
ncbi:UvrD-helicase domain-containing protein [Bradyrhizobium viridifuturi]|uniref:UvrD-helicase domain-containing protein n=1 Tax=Bradyrhizobium viridifuturi TaxID=1654716 RepID=UPI00067E88CE|nr:UvrD-helicase domain-containing protein [Bradyrhizobium viridifuturi]